MKHRLDLLWRRVATGAAFAFVFFGGMLLAAALAPSLLLPANLRRELVRKAIRANFRLLISMIETAGLLTLRVEGADRLATSRGRIVVANHPSLLDVVILIALVPQAQCIVKHQLWGNLLLGSIVRLAGYIRNDLPAEALAEACRASLAHGNNLIIFPEGSRTVPGVLPRFHRGFANLAIATGADVQLLFIACVPPTLLKGDAWWHVPDRKPEFRLIADEVVAPGLPPEQAHRGLAARHFVALVEAKYAQKLSLLQNS